MSKRIRSVEDDMSIQPPVKRRPSIGTSSAQQGGMPKVRDALGYLEKVKNKFQDQPQVYRKFLDIMKDFKAQTINTEGVIKRVKGLFKGHNELILGFNQFLPAGYRIEVDAEQKTMEFSHAVKYVAKIKERFSDQPEIYEEFLDILHAYQQKRTIAEVYQRVQMLFAGHPDLLEEFTYFLPDSSSSTPHKKGNKGKNQRDKGQRLGRGQPAAKRQSREKAEELLRRQTYSSEPERQTGDAAHGYGDVQRSKVKTTVTYPAGSEKEVQLFDRIKSIVPKTLYIQFLKCLNLYTLEIITRTELVSLITTLFSGKYNELPECFKNVIGYSEWDENQLMTKCRTNYYAFVSSVDFSTCKQITPSYRQLPKDLPLPPCSTRTTLCDDVLNNTCISIPTGTEDASFKTTRRNQYEGALFKVEDERYELDMVIEGNASAIRALDRIDARISALEEEELQHFEIGDENFDILHVRAIARLYGEHGYEIIELLKRNPVAVIPIVLQRLKQKDIEWRAVRCEMTRPWREICEKNYHKSLDHRSFYFKQDDKKKTSSKVLIQDLKDAHQRWFGSHRVEDKLENSEIESEELRMLREKEAPLYTYCMRFEYSDHSIHEDVYTIVSHVAKSQLGEEEIQYFHEFWTHFVHPFFNVAHIQSKFPNHEENISPSSASPSPVPACSGITGPSPSPLPSPPCVSPSVSMTGKSSEMFESEDAPVVKSDTSASFLAGLPSGTCKPLRISADAWALEEELSPMRKHTRKSRLFFGSVAFYVFFRLHQLVYERLLCAKELAYKNHRIGVNQSNDLSSVSMQKHHKFIGLLHRLVDNVIDNSSFEDDCRALLGASSYVLFTIDKLIMQLIKQIQVMVSHDKCQQILRLFKFENAKFETLTASKPITLGESAQMARVYESACSQVARDDTLIQVEFFDDTNEMGIGLLHCLTGHAKAPSKELTAYLEKYLNESSDIKQLPFLQRNKRLIAKKYPDPLKNIRQHNGLEIRICHMTFKFVFVENTEDVFVRKLGKKH